MFHIQVTQSFSRSKILRLNSITLLETKSIKIAQGWEVEATCEVQRNLQISGSFAGFEKKQLML